MQNMAIDGIYRKNNNTQHNNKDNKYATTQRTCNNSTTYQKYNNIPEMPEMHLDDVKEGWRIKRTGGKSPEYIPRVPRELIHFCPD